MFKKIIRKMIGLEPSNSISFQQAYDLTGFPIISLAQGKDKYNFLLDTGSTDNVIDSNILEQIEHEKIDYQGTLTGLDGIRNEVAACNITLSYKDMDYPFTYLVKDMKPAFDMMKSDFGVNLHGIIGSRFFNEYKYVLDFADLIAYSKE